MSIFDDLGKYTNTTAIITESSINISYEELLAAAERIGGIVSKKCLVVLVCNNSLESIAAYIGFLRVKAVPLLVSSSINKLFFDTLVSKYKPEFVFIKTQSYLSKLNYAPVLTYGRYTLYKTDYSINYTLHNDLALLLTTSGSTGSPKFVRQSYKNIYSNAKSITKYLSITSSDRPITTMPMSYSYGLSIINSHLLNGASIIVTEATLMEKIFWDNFKDNQATTFGGVPYIYEMLNKLRFSHMHLPSLKYITQAGGKLSIRLSSIFTDICLNKEIQFYMMYGQTEATSRMSYLPWQYADSKGSSIGIAIPGGSFSLEDENNIVINNNKKVGELVYRGNNVTMGYADSCFDLHKGDVNNGMLHTGDLAKRDAEGFYYITGRLKRFLKIFGNRVNLDEIEDLLNNGGYNCVCSGTDDKLKIYLTEIIDTVLIENFIEKSIGINRAGFTVEHIAKIPRNDSGKVIYSLLK
jgi:long-chain acyl-CoA synthetase